MRDSLNRMYEIMHMDKKVADINPSGICHIYEPDFLPYNLYLEEETDIDALVNNLTNFYYWCASRVLTLDRKYAKEILNFKKPIKLAAEYGIMTIFKRKMTGWYNRKLSRDTLLSVKRKILYFKITSCPVLADS